MKKFKLAAMIVGVSILATACGTKEPVANVQNDTTATVESKDSGSTTMSIDEAAAKTMAVESAGFAEADVEFVSAEMDSTGTTPMYKVIFTKDGMEYNYEISATDGSVITYTSKAMDEMMDTTDKTMDTTTDATMETTTDATMDTTTDATMEDATMDTTTDKTMDTTTDKTMSGTADQNTSATKK